MLQAIARMLGWAPSSPPIADTAIAAAPPPGLEIVRGGDPAMPPPLDETALRRRNRERAIAVARHTPPR